MGCSAAPVSSSLNRNWASFHSRATSRAVGGAATRRVVEPVQHGPRSDLASFAGGEDRRVSLHRFCGAHGAPISAAVPPDSSSLDRIFEKFTLPAVGIDQRSDVNLV